MTESKNNEKEEKDTKESLSEEDEIILNWLRNTIKASAEIAQRFFEDNGKV